MGGRELRKLLVVGNFGGVVAAVETKAKMAREQFPIYFQRVDAEVTEAFAGCGNLVIKLAGVEVAGDRAAFRSLPSGGFQFIEALQDGRVRIFDTGKLHIRTLGR